MAARNGKYSMEMKQQAVAYFNANQVPKQIEELLNKMFKERPDDIFGYMVCMRRFEAKMFRRLRNTSLTYSTCISQKLTTWPPRAFHLGSCWEDLSLLLFPDANY